MNQSVDEDEKESSTDEYGDRKVDEPPHAIFGDNECPENDNFAQEFFLHAYAVFTSVKGTFYESKEGNTYIRMVDHDRLAKHVVATLRGPCGNLEKWNYKVD